MYAQIRKLKIMQVEDHQHGTRLTSIASLSV